MKKIIIFSILCLMTGCAGVPQPYAQGPYVENFLGLRLGENKGFDSCSKENSGMRFGYEWRWYDGWSVAGAYEHTSHLFCGRPFNDKVDSFTDHVGVVVRKDWIK